MQNNPFIKGKKNYCMFYVVRHGETEWNVKGLIQGQGDSPLTDKGVLQVKEAAKELKNIHFDVFFSSDLLRAKRTAEIIALEHKLAVSTTKLLRERNYGHLDGKSTKELTKIYKIYDRLSDLERFKYKIAKDIESDEEVIGRFITFIREVAISHNNKTVFIATHAGVMRALLVHLGWLTYKGFLTKRIHNASYIKLLSDGVEFFIEETRGIENVDNKPK